jgi:hypothetical protein
MRVRASALPGPGYCSLYSSVAPKRHRGCLHLRDRVFGCRLGGTHFMLAATCAGGLTYWLVHAPARAFSFLLMFNCGADTLFFVFGGHTHTHTRNSNRGTCTSLLACDDVVKRHTIEVRRISHTSRQLSQCL